MRSLGSKGIWGATSSEYKLPVEALPSAAPGCHPQHQVPAVDSVAVSVCPGGSGGRGGHGAGGRRPEVSLLQTGPMGVRGAVHDYSHYVSPSAGDPENAVAPTALA